MNVLSWSTANEENNLGFEVQRSIDGANFSTIGFVNSLAANGNSGSILNYSFTDELAGAGTQYYRLRQLDRDYRAKLSTIVAIEGENPTVLKLSGLYPNPVQSVVNLRLSAPATTHVMVSITDLNGRVMNQQAATMERGSNTLSLAVDHLAAGTYIVKVSPVDAGASPVVCRFVKK